MTQPIDIRRFGPADARLMQALNALFGEADYSDPPAVALHEKLGVREEVLHYDLKPLPD